MSKLIAAIFSVCIALSAKVDDGEVHDLSDYFKPAKWVNVETGFSLEKSEGDGLGIMAADQQRGLAWSSNKIAPGEYELVLRLIIDGEGRSARNDSLFDGISIWFCDNTTIAELTQLYRSTPAADMALNFPSVSKCFGTYLSISNRGKESRPSASVVFNGGESFSVDRIPTEFGMYWDFTDLKPLDLRYRVSGSEVTVDVRGGDEPWELIAAVIGEFDVSGFIGVSTSNLKVNGYHGASVVLESVKMSTLQSNYASVYTSAEESLEIPRAPNDVNEDDDQISILMKMANQVDKEEGVENQSEGPKLETDVADPLMSSNNEFRMDVKILSEKLDQLADELRSHQLEVKRSVLAAVSDLDPKEKHRALEEAIRSLRKDLMLKQHELQKELLSGQNARSENLMRSDDSLKSLRANAASLESEVRKATMYSTYFACGLSASFLGFGLLIYKRMKDMEKKHFL